MDVLCPQEVFGTLVRWAEAAVAADEWDSLNVFLENHGVLYGVSVLVFPSVHGALQSRALSTREARSLLDRAEHANHLSAAAMHASRSGCAAAQPFTDVERSRKTSEALEWIRRNVPAQTLAEYDKLFGACACTGCCSLTT